MFSAATAIAGATIDAILTAYCVAASTTATPIDPMAAEATEPIAAQRPTTATFAADFVKLLILIP